MNEVIAHLAMIKINEQSVFTQIHLQWDEKVTEQNKFKLGTLVRKTFNYPGLTGKNEDYIVSAVDAHYGGNIKKRSDLLCNCTMSGIDQLSEEVKIVLKKSLGGASGLVKDMHTINRCKEKLGMK